MRLRLHPCPAREPVILKRAWYICFGAYDGPGSVQRVEWTTDAVIGVAGIVGALGGRPPVPGARLVLLVTGFAVAVVCVGVRVLPRWLNELEVD